MPQISVIIPVYNCETYIEKTIHSVMAQSYTDWELLLVNDGSTDGSRKICADMAVRDPRIRLIDKENGGGAGEARNVGVGAARAPFITFLDADDYYDERILETYIRAQESKNADVVIAGYEEFVEGETGTEKVCYAGGFLSERQAVRDFFVAHYPEGLLGFPWNKLYRSEIIKDNGINFPKMRRLEDGIFNVAYFEHCETAVILSDTGVYYRESGQVEKGKLPYDFYDLMEEFVEGYMAVLKRWNYGSAFEQPIIDYFQNDFVSCLENILMPFWPYPKQERLSYIADLSKRPLVRRMVNAPVRTGRYTKMVITAYRDGRFGRAVRIMKMKLLLKTRLHRVFYRLKKIIN